MIPARFRTLPRPAPGWELHGEHESLSFTAVQARLWTFGAMIAAVTISAGVLVSVLAITLTPESGSAARMLIAAAALCLCLPLMLLVNAPFRARTVPVALSYDPDALTITISAEPRRIAFSEIDSLIWCTGTEYSRIVIDGASVRYSLLVGIARPLDGLRSDLPEISTGLKRTFEDAGLLLSASSAQYTRYRR